MGLKEAMREYEERRLFVHAEINEDDGDTRGCEVELEISATPNQLLAVVSEMLESIVRATNEDPKEVLSMVYSMYVINKTLRGE